MLLAGIPRHKTQNEKEKPGRTNEKRSGADVRLESFGSESGQHVLCPGDEEFFRSGFFAQGVGCFEAGFRKVGGGHVFKGLVTVALRFLNGADQKDILRFRQRERQSVIVRLGKKHGDSAFLMIHSIVSGDTVFFCGIVNSFVTEVVRRNLTWSYGAHVQKKMYRGKRGSASGSYSLVLKSQLNGKKISTAGKKYSYFFPNVAESRSFSASTLIAP